MTSYKEQVTPQHITAAQKRANEAYSNANTEAEAYHNYRREMEMFNNAVRYNELYIDLTPRERLDSPEFKRINFYFASQRMNITSVHQCLRDLVGTKHHEQIKANDYSDEKYYRPGRNKLFKS